MNIRFLLLVFLINSGGLYAQPVSPLQKPIDSILSTTDATVGIAILHLETGQRFSLNSDHRFPMQSTFKLPLAIVVLQQVDKGQLTLDHIVHLPQSTLDAATWSPMVKEHPGQDIDISIAALLNYMVSQSDNNACDALFRLMGGPQRVNTIVHSWGVAGIHIAATEAEMKKAWKVQYTNWETPPTAILLLEKFYKGQLLSKNSYDFLYQALLNSRIPERLKGLLPATAIVAHKPGTSGRNEEGLLAACNDMGIITLPNGQHLAIAVFVSNTKQDDGKASTLIAAISKTAWDYYTSGRVQ